MIPQRRKRPKMMPPKEDAPISCPGHGKWVRGLTCFAVGLRATAPLGSVTEPHECVGRMEAHHEETRGSGGGDETLIPACSLAHRLLHDGCTFPVNLEAMRTELWRVSPHGVRYRQQHAPQDPAERPYTPISTTAKA